MPATIALALAMSVTTVFGEDEHSTHHPQGRVAPAPGQPSAGGMMGEMGKMMEGMHGPPPKELYPALMELPDLPLEKRAEVQERAHSRMTGGLGRMSAAVAELSTGAERDDFAAMQEAAESLRQALAEFDSGLAAHRALAEGKAPRSVALRWFKREMNLLEPSLTDRPHGFFGLSWFHYFSMAVLAVFAATLAAIQLARMRRARELAAMLGAPPSGLPGNGGAASGDAPAPAVGVPASLPVERAESVPSTTGSWSGRLRAARIFQETADVTTFRLAPVEGEELPFTFEPGQFLTVAVTVDGRLVKRSYSIASSPCCHGWCEITVKHAPGGVVSGHLRASVKVGDVLDVAGPYGRFTFRGREAPNVVMIAGGVGITPMMSSIRYLTDQSWDGDIHLIYACRNLENVIFREELDYLVKRHPNLHATLVLSREPSESWSGARGHVTGELLAKTVPDLPSRRVHLCGPPPMIDALRQALAELGVPKDQVKSELFLAPEVTAPLPAPFAVAATCTFARSGKKAPLPPDRTLLEVAEGVGVAIDYSCLQGFCGVCKVKLVSGTVAMAVEDGLGSKEKAAGWILACQARAGADVTVDA